MRIPRALLGLLLILAGIAVGGFVWQQSLPADGDAATIERSLSAGTRPPSTSSGPATPQAAPTAVSQPSPSTAITAVEADPEPLWSANTPVTPGDQPVPVGLRIDALDVEAPVIPTGVDPRTGDMEVPANVDEVAWYRHGSGPGEPGSAVLAAHVDLAGQGPGVFFQLSDLGPGDIVEVEMEDGTVAAFVVEARTVYPKDELPLEAIFSREGPPTLTLVTCGGGFDRSSRSYDSNVVVYATPIPEEVSPDRQ
jgi:LPXTG-site transpeptidase (sortase) family protein